MANDNPNMQLTGLLLKLTSYDLDNIDVADIFERVGTLTPLEVKSLTDSVTTLIQFIEGTDFFFASADVSRQDISDAIDEQVGIEVPEMRHREPAIHSPLSTEQQAAIMLKVALAAGFDPGQLTHTTQLTAFCLSDIECCQLAIDLEEYLDVESIETEQLLEMFVKQPGYTFDDLIDYLDEVITKESD